MSTAINSAALNTAVNNYTYSYQGKFQPKLDKNDDAVWDRSELKNYADAFNKATGQTLDVDKLMEKYANEDGVIDSKAQAAMRADDALGLSVLQGKSTTASSSSTSTSSATSTTTTPAMSQNQRDAAISAVKQFTYDYKGTLKPLLDKDDDGMWSKEELNNYATAYNKATGKELDVDALMEKYGNEDGYIDPKNQAKMKEADALGLTNLKASYNTAVTTKDTSNMSPKAVYWDDLKKANASSSDYSISDLLSTMSPERKMAYSVAVNRLDAQSNMLSAMMGASGGSSFDLFSIASAQNSAKLYSIQAKNDSSLYNAMSGNALNFTI